MKEVPLISVIITAHDRKDFITEAVLSAVEQTIDRELYEIIVVKNFEEEPLDNMLKKNVIKNIFTEVKESGGKLALGINASKGRILVFLDDDDVLDKSKLQRVRELFESHPNLKYYHNHYETIDVHGQKTNELLYEPPRADEFFVGDKFDKANLSYILNAGIYFNTSCISVSRDLLDGQLQNLGRMGALVDNFLFLMAINKNATLLIGKDVLTYYRVHNSTSLLFSSLRKFREFNEELSKRRAENYEMLLGQELDGYAFKIAYLGLLQWQMIWRIMSLKGRKEVFRLLLEYTRQRPSLKVHISRDLVIACTFYLFSPRLVNYLSIFLRRHKIEKMKSGGREGFF